MKIANVKQMQNMDRSAVENYQIPELLLMENAGLAVTGVISDYIEIPDTSFLVVCGLGNNGGDGFVIARELYSRKGQVSVAIIGDPANYSGVAQQNYDILQALPIENTAVESADDLSVLLHSSSVIVDAIFGTGITRKVEGRYAEIINSINQAGKTVVSVDIPSGINGDNGQIMGVAVQADFTITFGLPKLGNILYPGYNNCGDLYISHISFPPELYQDDNMVVEFNQWTELPDRDPAGHKGSFGDTLIIAGAASYYGAPHFAANSFLKAGGGYARLAAPETVIKTIAAEGSEIVFLPQKETESGSLALSNLDNLIQVARKADFVIIGPGISLDSETCELVCELVKTISVPLLIDGDGLTIISQQLQLIKDRKAPTVLTPHLGEMARISDSTVAEINSNPIGILQKSARELDAYIVMKGAHSLVGNPNGKITINMSGNSGMATAGSGDVLTGTIAAAFGLGLELEKAVCKGVFLHGLAGDLAAEEIGIDGITATDILNFLPRAVNYDRQGLSDEYLSTILPELIDR